MPEDQIITWPGDPVTEDDFIQAPSTNGNNDELQQDQENNSSTQEEARNSPPCARTSAASTSNEDSAKSSGFSGFEPVRRTFSPTEINVTLNSSAFEDSLPRTGEITAEEAIPILKATSKSSKCVQLRFPSATINAVVDTGCDCILMPRTQFDTLKIPFKPLRKVRLITASEDWILGDEVGPF